MNMGVMFGRQRDGRPDAMAANLAIIQVNKNILHCRQIPFGPSKALR